MWGRTWGNAMKALTERTVRTAGPGRYGDSASRGLMLIVRESGARRWVLRYQLGGKRRDMGLGPYPEVGLAAARERALSARRLIKLEGKDPITERKRVPGATFEEMAAALIAAKR